METTSKKDIQDANGHRYGLLSMLAMIIGIVIGSGIYVVNDQLYAASNGSTGISMISWLIVSFIVLFMLISFIEISSITSRKHEAGTMNNWSRYLWGENVSKYLGVFFPLIYYPVLLSGFSMIMSSEIMGNVSKFDTIDNSKEVWMYFLYSTIAALFLLNLIFAMNTFTSKPGKLFQEVGTFIKLIPLFMIVIIGFIAMVGIFGGAPPSNDVFNLDQNNALTNGNKNTFIVILILSPTIMFSYDGFLFAASLQNEAKKPSTYKTAAISGIVFIILIYILMSFFTFAYGTDETGFSVDAAFRNMFPSVGNWFFTLISIMIIISVITGISGNTIAQNRMIADVSVENQMADKDGKMIARNKAYVPQKSSQLAWVITIIVFIVFRMFDLFATIAFLSDDSIFLISPITGSLYINYNSSVSIISALNDLVLIAFTFYAFIIVGGLLNRKTKKVDVDKNKMFIASAIISIISIAVVLIVFAMDIFAMGNLYNTTYEGDQIGHAYLTYNYVFKIFIFFAIIAAIVIVPNIINKNVKKMNEDDKSRKALLIEAYNQQKIDPRFI